jgi:co-chaperonin GroES (HSP10)
MIRPMNDRIRVKIDPDKEMTSGGIIKPDDAHEGVLATGVVLDVGPGCWAKKGNKREPMGLEKGEGVVFVKFHHLTETNKGVQHVIGKDELLLQPNDILLVYDRKDPPEFV